MTSEEFSESVKEYFKNGVEAFLPHVSINCTVFGFENPDLKVLVQHMPWNDSWLLPGGYVYKDEDLDSAAYRNLRLSGLDRIFLRQFKAFVDISPINNDQLYDWENITIPDEIFAWLSQRFITVVYYAVVDYTKVQLKPGLWSSESDWRVIHQIEDLALNHAQIVREARKVLAEDLLNFPVVANFLPDTFTIPELRKLYEAILNRPIDRGTFRRKIISLRILDKVGIQIKTTRRPAQLYTLNQEQYLRSLMEEAKFGF